MSFLWEGIVSVTWQQLVMYVVGGALIYLAIKKEYEPALLLPMGFGAILVNLPGSNAVNQVLQGVGEVNGIVSWLYDVGIEASEALPLLLFIGIGAMIDFDPLLPNPLCSCLVRQPSLVFLLLFYWPQLWDFLYRMQQAWRSLEPQTDPPLFWYPRCFILIISERLQ